MAAPNVREKAQVSKDQGEVWAEVSNAERANNTSSATGTLNSVFKDKKVEANLGAYESALRSLLPKNAVGIVAAIDGVMISADVFAAQPLFNAYWPKLLRSLALQATSSETRNSDSPTIDEARAFLMRSEEQKGSEERRPLYRLVERKSDEEASFELASPSSRAASVIHFNKVAKR